MRGAAFLLALLAVQAALPYLPVSSAPTILSPGARVSVYIPAASNVSLIMPNGTIIPLTPHPPDFASWSNLTLLINTSSLPLGEYRVVWPDGGYSFVLDGIEVGLESVGKDGRRFVVRTLSELTGSPLSAEVTIFHLNGTLNLSSSPYGRTKPFTLPPGNYTLRIVAVSGNLTGELTRDVSVPAGKGKGGEKEGSKPGSKSGHRLKLERKVYFPGEEVILRIPPPPPGRVVVVYPDNSSRSLQPERSKHDWVVRIPLNSSVMLGRYEIRVDNESIYFYVDHYELNASYEDGLVRGRVSFYFVPPEEVLYRFSSGKRGRVRVVNGTFVIPVPSGEREVELRCGNAVLTLTLVERRVELERKVYFPGDVVVVRSTFEPVNGTLIDPSGREVRLRFERAGDHWEARYALNSSVLIGNYSVEVDGIRLSFVVDSYQFELSYEPGKGIMGRVEYQVLPPSEISYSVEGLKGNASVVNGTFVIPVTLSRGEHRVVLGAWGRDFVLVISVNVNVSPGSPAEIDQTRGKTWKVIAYDPVSRTLVIGLLSHHEVKGIPLPSKGVKALRKIEKHVGDLIFSQYELPADPEMLRRFRIPEDVLNTKVWVKRVNETLVRLRVENKLEVWYRFSVKIPPGYRVKEIVRADGKRIVNDLRVNRTTGEVIGELRWYVENGVLYFFDDPIYGYDVTLVPPAPNESLAIEEVEAGQISAIVFPYSQGDDYWTIQSHDHAGRSGDGFANDIDADAGSKIAIRYTTPGGTRQYGNDGYLYQTGDYTLTQLSRENVTINTVPNGVLESVIITNMSTDWSGYELEIVKKTIIRDNNRWFATIYYLRNPTSSTYTGLRFFQGMDWNFAGSFWGDDAYYDAANDVVYGYDTNAPSGDIQYGGFRAEQASVAHDVNRYGNMWLDIYYNSLNNDDYYSGDAGTALAWDRVSLGPGEIWVIPVIWGLGYTEDDMLQQISDGLSRLHDTGIESIDFPENGSRINPHVTPSLWVNATAALYGLVDALDTPVRLTVEKVGGGYYYTETTQVSLAVPHQERANVSFLLDVSSLTPGAYEITVETQLPSDQNTSNDAKTIVIYITSFSVGPDQEETVYPGSEASYNVTASNYDEATRFDVSIVNSTRNWPTELYYGSSLVAEDSDGDGAWDFVASGYDTNGNGLPDLYLPLGETNVTVVKIVPSTAPLGELDLTALNFSKIGDPSVHDEVSLYTRTVYPQAEGKQFYLHGDAQHTMNTTTPTVSSSYTIIDANSLDSWAQRPPFAASFTLTGEVVVNLYLASSYYSTHDLVVGLLYTDGATVYSVGSSTTSVYLSSTPTLVTLTIPLDSTIEVPQGYYLVLRIENQGTSYPLYVYHDSSRPSRVEVSTTTYVRVDQASSDGEIYSPGDTITIDAKVSDPIGAYDISEVRITVYNPDETVYLTDTMTLTSEDPSTPPLWRTYTYSFSLTDYGAYRVEVRAFETNGVSSSYNLTVYVGWQLVGRVYEDFGVLGSLDSSDRGIPNVRVLLYNDTNGNGILDYPDRIIDYDVTDSSGYYSLRAIVNGRVFVAVDSLTVISTSGLNPGHGWDEVWAEQTFQREWDGASWVLQPKFGGRDPTVDDMEGGAREHYVAVEPSYYSGQSLDFGFSFEVVVNTLDRASSGLRPVGEVFKIPNVGSSWKEVFTHNFYEDPVVVCTYNLPSSSDREAVVRLKDVGHHSFYVRVQNPGGSAVTPSDVYCIVMESGSWELDDGRPVEAYKVISDGTNSDGDWSVSAMEHVPYSHAYTQPVVLGQVMSYNDSRWSVFWDCNGVRTNPPDASNLYVGKHVGEDPDTVRSSEVLGYIVVEAGNGTTGGLRYTAQLGPDTVMGVGNSPPYTYTLDGTYSVGVATLSAMDGVNGGWAVFYGSDPITTEMHLAIDEDTLSDTERWHTDEQVAYWAFESEGIIWGRTDSERYAQGSLRQFFANANALAGIQRSYFVMMVDPNVPYAQSWRISVNSTLGPLPALNDPSGTVLNGTVYNQDMTVRDSNAGTAGSTGTVGTGPDGIVSTGDECILPGVEKPEIEVYGGGLSGVGIAVNASNTWVYGLSIFGFSSLDGSIYVNGSHSLTNVSLSGLLVGLTSSGEDPSAHGLKRNELHGLVVEAGGSPEVILRDSLIGYNGYSGAVFRGGTLSGTIYRVESFENGVVSGSEDGISLVGAGGLEVNCSYLHDNAAYGLDALPSPGDLVIVNSNLTGNGVTGLNGEDGGLRITGNNSVVNATVISGNGGPGVVIANWTDGVHVSLNNSILVNAIFSNGEVGIDLDATHSSTNPVGDNVTLNDGLLDPSQPNQGLDYPVIVSYSYDPVSDTLSVSGYINREDAYSGSSTFAGARVLIYLVRNLNGGDDLAGNNYSGDSELSTNYGEGWIYLGSLISDSNGEFSGTLDLSGLPDWAKPDSGTYLSAITFEEGVGTSEFGPSVASKPISVSVKKSMEPSGDCTLDVSLTVSNLNPWITVTKVYDVLPEGMTLVSYSSPPSGSSGNVYWWSVTLGPEGTPEGTKTITYTMASVDCGTTDFNLSEAQVVGIDPPAPEVNVNVSDYLDVRFHADGSYEVLDHWGFITAMNPTNDTVSDLRIYLDAPGYTFYPDYPVPSNAPVDPPLRAPSLPPGDYVRWRFEGPRDQQPPITLEEELFPDLVRCGERRRVTLHIKLTALAPVEGVRLVKPLGWLAGASASASSGSVDVAGGEIRWVLGPMGRGESADLYLRGWVSPSASLHLPDARVTVNSSAPPLLDGLLGVRFTGPASVNIEKERIDGGYELEVSFVNAAGDLTYRLTSVCVYEGDPSSGRLVFCEEPGTLVGPGGSWASSPHKDEPSTEPPAYYAVANFTGVAEVSGTYSLMHRVGGGFEQGATLVEPVLRCEMGAPGGTAGGGGEGEGEVPPRPGLTTVTGVPGRVGEKMPPKAKEGKERPRPPEVTETLGVSAEVPEKLGLTKVCQPAEVEVGGLVKCVVTVTNEGNVTARDLEIVDIPNGLRILNRRVLKGQPIIWRIPRLDPGQEVSFEAIFQAMREGILVNTARMGNLTASFRVKALPAERHISLQKMGIYLGRGEVEYVIRVRGPVGLQLVDTLPEEADLLEVWSPQEVRWAHEGRTLRIWVDGGSAVVFVRVHIPLWKWGVSLKNRVEVPGGPFASSSVLTWPVSRESMIGFLLTPASLLILLLLFVRRRRAMLVDYLSLTELLLSGIKPSHGLAVTEATASKAMSDPVLAPVMKELLSTGSLHIREIGEAASIRALELAVKSGMDVRDVAEMLALLGVGEELVESVRRV